jgi:hypothetical protein
MSGAGREWSEDEVDLVMTWVLEMPMGWLAEIEGRAAVLVAEVWVSSVFE